MPYIAFLLIVLSSVAFFNYHAIFSQSAAKALFYMAVLAGGAVVVLKHTSGKRVAYPRRAWALLMLGLVISIFMGTYYHEQNFKMTFVSTLPVLFAYSTFVIFIGLGLPVRKIMNAFLVLTVLSSIVYFCNVATMPNNAFGEQIELNVERGIVRIPLVFNVMFPVLMFYSINRYLEDKRKIWILIWSFLMFMTVLSVVRQVIVYSAILSIFFVLRKVSFKIKALICVGIVGVIIFVLPMIPVYKAMVELSEEQIDENEDQENVRITAWRYYTYENQTGELTPFLGNGVPSLGKSIWGIAFDAETEENGCFYVDVGWAGMYWLYGALSVAGLLWLMIATFVKKKPDSLKFIDYGIGFFFLINFTSGPTVYYYQIILLMLLLAIPYTVSAEEMPAETKELQPESRPTLWRRFPQLR